MASVVVGRSPLAGVVGGVGLVSVGVGAIAVGDVIERLRVGVEGRHGEAVARAAHELQIERVVGLIGVGLGEERLMDRRLYVRTIAIESCRNALIEDEVLIDE